MQYCKDHNAIPACLNYEGYPKSVCTSINEVVCHGIPKEEDVLEEGDISQCGYDYHRGWLLC